MEGLNVLVGLVDADYQGEVYIMVQIVIPPLHIPQGSCIAQLIPLLQMSQGITPHASVQRKDKGFGSTGGLTLVTVDLHQRPKQTVRLEYQGKNITLMALLDTGVDSSIMDAAHWPKGWPTLTSNAMVSGVGGVTLAKKSPLLTLHIEGKRITCTLSIIPLPEIVQCLIGRDVLSQLGMVLTTELPL